MVLERLFFVNVMALASFGCQLLVTGNFAENSEQRELTDAVMSEQGHDTAADESGARAVAAAYIDGLHQDYINQVLLIFAQYDIEEAQ